MPLRRSFSAGELASRQRRELREQLASKETEDSEITFFRLLKDGMEVPLNATDFRHLLAHDMIALTFCDTQSAVSYWIKRGKWPPIWTSDFEVLVATSSILDTYDQLPNDAAEQARRQRLAAAAEVEAAYELMFSDTRDDVLSRPPTPGRGLLFDSDSEAQPDPDPKELDKNGEPGGASGSQGSK